jgi:hypothetical protein
MDMDWDQLATLAQLVTGVATLGVAVLLVSQLRQQHRDAEREILYTSQGRMQDLMRSVMTSDFGPIWTKGGQDFNSLNPVEKEQYRAWCYSVMTLQGVNAQAGHEGLDRGVASRLQAQTAGGWKAWPGMGIYYEQFGRSHTYNPDLRALFDSVFLERFGREIDTTWEWGVRETAS